VINLLYNAYPEAIVNAQALFRRGIDNSRFVNGVEDFIVQQLRYAAQASNLQLVRTQDGNGRLPLHHALGEDAPLGAIKLLVQADRSTIQTPDSDGSLPLHTACEYHKCPDVIKYLLDNCRASLLVAEDKWGNTPLHYACLEGRYDAIEMILTRYPNAPVATRNLDGDLPIQLLLDCDAPYSADYASCIFLLLKASPEVWMSNEDLVLALTSLPSLCQFRTP
jgi:ankyrin repeat protein